MCDSRGYNAALPSESDSDSEKKIYEMIINPQNTMKRDDFLKNRLLNKIIGEFFILSLFSYFSVCFLTLKLLCVKKV